MNQAEDRVTHTGSGPRAWAGLLAAQTYSLETLSPFILFVFYLELEILFYSETAVTHVAFH